MSLTISVCVGIIGGVAITRLSFIRTGLGSVLSPSGDEEGVSDQESLLSPLSVGSSIGGSREDLGEDELSSSPANTDGETDYIEEDLPPSCPAHVQALTIPPPKHTSGSSSSRAKKVCCV